MGPAELVRATVIAREYYLAGRTKTEIADAHGLSRYKVARILDACLSQGIVRIEIDSQGFVDADLSEQLQSAYQLRHAIVVRGPFADVGALRSALGQAAAGLLAELVTEDDVLGITWGRSLDAMVQQVGALPPCQIVQLTGIAGGIRASSVDLMRQLVGISQGSHYPIYAPLFVSDAATAAALHRQPGIQAAIARWASITIAVVAIGSWDAAGSQLYPTLSDADRRALDSFPVMAETCSILFDPDGRPLRTPLTRRTLAISYEELSQVPEVIAVAGGVIKTEAIGSVLRGRAITSLVTDDGVARQLLNREPRLLPRPAQGRPARPAEN